MQSPFFAGILLPIIYVVAVLYLAATPYTVVLSISVHMICAVTSHGARRALEAKVITVDHAELPNPTSDATTQSVQIHYNY